MNKLVEIYRLYMIRPIVYKTVTRLALCATAVLLWNRYINKDGLLSASEDAFFILGVFSICMAWFNYLSLDGMRIKHFREKNPKPRRKNHQRKDIVDFVDEKIISFDELKEDEKMVCKLSSNMLVGVLLIAISQISLIF